MPADPWYIFNCPLVVHFGCPPRHAWTYFELAHLAATPVGSIIRTEVEIIKVDGRRVEFAFPTFDEREKVADGTHERYVTKYENFKERRAAKLG